LNKDAPRNIWLGAGCAQIAAEAEQHWFVEALSD
jgi:hypothetical protein